MKGGVSFWSNHSEFLKQRVGGHGAGLMPIQNKDQLCIARAIVFGICRAESKESVEKMNLYNSVRHGDEYRYTKQQTMALDLMRRAGLRLDRPCGMEEYPRLQEAMPAHYRLCIYSKDHYFSRIYAGDDQRKQQISLYIYDTHCSLINSMPQFFGHSYWCFECDKGYDDQEDHRCKAVCPGCFEWPPCNYDRAEHPECQDCLRSFRSQQCFDAHKRNYIIDQNGQQRKRKPLCQRLKLCKECRLKLTAGHKCGFSTCHVCKEEYRGEHLCYINTYTGPKQRKGANCFIFFDAESTIDTPLECQNEFGSMTEHIVNSGISWRSKKQTVVAQSTAEAEYVALFYTAQECVWVRGLLEELKEKQVKPTVIFEDNQSAIKITSNPVNHPQTKHIAVRYHYSHQQLEDGVIKLVYCPSKQMVADILTKPVARDQFEVLRDKFGLAPPSLTYN